MQKITKICISAASVFLLSLSAAPVFAEGGISGSGHNDVNETQQTSSNVTKVAETETETETHTATDVSNKKSENSKLTSNRQKSCTNKENAINNITKRIAERGQRQIDTFSKIADRTEAFYTAHSLSVSNYDALVSTVNSKKATAQATVNKISQDKVDFKCDGTDHPKSAADGFKTDLKSETNALKEYKTAIKNLIVAVKSSKSDATTGGNQ